MSSPPTVYQRRLEQQEGDEPEVERVNYTFKKQRIITVTDDSNPYSPVTREVSVGEERHEIEYDAKRMILDMGKTIKATAWRKTQLYLRGDTRLMFVHEVYRALGADLEAVMKAVAEDLASGPDERAATAKLIKAKSAAWKKAIAATRRVR